MLIQQVNIALVSDDPVRIQRYTGLLKDPGNKIIVYSFNEALQNGLIEGPLDLVVFDCFSNIDFDYLYLEPLRLQQKLKSIPFLFILHQKQETLKRQIYNKSNNNVLIEPIDKFSFISLITSSLHLTKLEKHCQLYKDIVDGEKKLISYMDELLEMSRILQINDEVELYHHLQIEFVRRLELALAIETALFAPYNNEEKALSISLFDDQHNKIVKRHTFTLKKSEIERLLHENYPYIFEENQITDSFIQELEESLGFKIFGLLFIPITVFHQPRAGIILINKLYRNEFTENDLAFCLIAAQKITFHLENIYLKRLNSGRQSNVDLLLGKDNKIVEEWKLYHSMMSSVNFGIIVFDQDYNIYYLNKAARQILHTDSKEKSDKNLKDFFTSNEFTQIQKNVESGQFPIVRQEIQLLMQNIPDYFVGYSIYPFDLKGERKKYIIIFSEISHTKRLQAEVIKMDRMVSLGILSSGIAHEIRNPLAGIKAMAQTLEDELESDSSQIEYVERILRQVNRLDDLLRVFFSYAKPQRPNPSAIHIQKIIKEVIPLFERKMREENITIQQSYAKDLDKVFVDSNQIEQVFLNLFINALDAMSGEGKLTISAKKAEHIRPMIDRRGRSPGLFSDRYIEILISDTGLGIPESVKDKIFNPFFTTKSNGTGLGLSIVYQIIKEHGGQIDVKSEPGKGSEFIILLPALSNDEKDKDNLIS